MTCLLHWRLSSVELELQLAVQLCVAAYKRTKKHVKNEQRSRDAAAKKESIQVE